jgi:hypothetical protein
MPTELPTTVIGLIAFVVAGAGALLWRFSSNSGKANNKTIETFMTYIETRNHSLEKTTDKFLEKMEERDLKFDDALIKQGERHQQGMDDLAARLENSWAKK